MGSHAGIIIPAWVRGLVGLPRPREVMKRESIKYVLRKMREHGYEYEATRDPEKFKFFYQRMYLPYIRSRHGDTVFVHSWDQVKAHFDAGELILVKKQDKYLCGNIISYKDTIARMPFLGVLDGNHDLVAEGVLAAVYECFLQHVEKKGLLSADLGESRAFIKDGVLAFKKKFGYTIFNTSIHKYLVRIVSDNPATRAFLENNLFIFQHAGNCYGAVFLPPSVPPSLDTLHSVHRRFSYPGLNEVIAIFFAADPAASQPQLDSTTPINPATTKSTLPHDQPRTRTLIHADYAPMFGPLGNLAIAHAIAVLPPLVE